MIYMVVKMSSAWYAREIDSYISVLSNLEEHVKSGELVVFTDDLEGFRQEFDLDYDDIVIMED